MKKILFSIFSFVSLVWLTGTSISAQYLQKVVTPSDKDFPYETRESEVGDNEKLGAQMTEQVMKTDGMLPKLLQILWLNPATYLQNPDTPAALIYIRGIINLLLGLTSFIALIMVIFSFYLLFFSEDAKGMDKVKKNLKGVAIALIILGLSRSIVSFIFNFYQTQIVL